MGLLDRASDSLIHKVTKQETIRISYKQLAEIVKEKFIIGSDDEFLKKVLKTAKGGYFSYAGKLLNSVDKKYTLSVGTRHNNILFLFGGGMYAYVLDNEENKCYQLDKNRHWKKFYKAVETAINTEKINR